MDSTDEAVAEASQMDSFLELQIQGSLESTVEVAC